MSISAPCKIQHQTAHKRLKHALPEDKPPANIANLPTETAPIELRATLSSAVDYLPVALSNTSVALKTRVSEMNMRRERQCESYRTVVRLRLSTSPRARTSNITHDHFKIAVGLLSPEVPTVLMPPANMAMLPADAVELPKRATLS
jgi:hypothetical protein